MPDDPEPCWTRAPDVIECHAGEELGLLIRNGWETLELDPTTQRIWTLLAQPHSIPQVVEALMAEFSVSAEECRTGVEQILRTLHERNAITLQSC